MPRGRNESRAVSSHITRAYLSVSIEMRSYTAQRSLRAVEVEISRNKWWRD